MTASWALSGTNAADFLPQTPVPGTPCIDGGTLAAGTSCALAYAFHPTTAAAETATFTLTTNVPPPGTAVLTATLTGTGIYPAVTIAPSSLAFDPQVVGTTSDAQTVTLTNSGTDTLNISSITLGGTNANQFATTTCGATLAVGGHCTIDVTFHPTSMNGKSASLVIADDVPYPSGGTQSVSLTGTGTAPGVGLAPASLTFTDQLVGTTSAQQTVTVTNTGTSPLTVSAVAASGNFAVTNGCTSAVAAGGTCTIWVTFTPTTTGTRTGTLTITDDAGTVPGTTQTVGLTGTGIAPVASLTPSPIDFGSVNMNTTSAASTATLANTGGAIMHITAVGISGDYAFASGGTCTAAPFTLAADASCTFKITFTPTALGTRTGTLSVTDDSMNVAGTIQTVALTGVTKTFTFTVPAGGGSKTVTAGSSATYSLTVNAGGGFSGVVNFTCSTAPSTTITCTVSPTSYTFDATHTSVAVTVTVTTTARAMGAPLTVPRAPLGGLGTLPGQAFLMLLMMLLALSALRRRRAWMLLAATLLFVAMLAACGAAAPVAAPPAAKPPGTSAGTYSISVTGTGGGTTVTVPLTLIVN
jgi:predicted small lipoprotein YifL